MTGWRPSRVTRLDDLALFCAHHHDLASYAGWTLTGPPGRWQWRPPPGGVPPGPFDDDGVHLAAPPRTARPYPQPAEAVRAGPAAPPDPPEPRDDPLGLFDPRQLGGCPGG